MAPRFLTARLRPEGFHGKGLTRRFFEGWYVKLVSADRAHRWAVIPGVFLGLEQGGEAFVQVLDGTTGRSWYHPFPLSEFEAHEERWEVRVGPNRFSPQGVSLRLSEVGGALDGDISFDRLHPWPVSLASPGIMGPFAWTPFLECYHGVLGFHHTLDGTLRADGREAGFSGGTGYVEKDWGQAFPRGYVWMQTNHFAGHPRASLIASIAHIPFLMTSFRGFIVGLWLDGHLHRFATYTGARTEHLHVDDHEIRWTLIDRKLRLELVADRPRGGLLHAPVRTEMHRRVEETLDATVKVRLSERSGRVLFEDVGSCGGLEVHGELELIRG